MRKLMVVVVALTALVVWLGLSTPLQAAKAKLSAEDFKKADLNKDGKIDMKEAIKAGLVAPPQDKRAERRKTAERKKREAAEGPRARRGREHDGRHKGRRGHPERRQDGQGRRPRHAAPEGRFQPRGPLDEVLKNKLPMAQRFAKSLSREQVRMLLALVPDRARRPVLELIKRLKGDADHALSGREHPRFGPRGWGGFGYRRWGTEGRHWFGRFRERAREHMARRGQRRLGPQADWRSRRFGAGPARRPEARRPEQPTRKPEGLPPQVGQALRHMMQQLRQEMRAVIREEVRRAVREARGK